MRRKIKELMTGFSEIVVVDENSTLFEAFLEISVVRASHHGRMRCLAALVVDNQRNVAGFLDFRSMLKGLQPGYVEISQSAMEGGFSPQTIKTELEKNGLWVDSTDLICKTAGETLIKSVMTLPEESQITDADASVNEAMYQMIVTGKDYLFVRNGTALTGVISLADIMTHVCDTVKACRT